MTVTTLKTKRICRKLADFWERIWWCKHISECMSHPFQQIIKANLFKIMKKKQGTNLSIFPPSCDIVILWCFCLFLASTSNRIWRLTKLDQPKSAIVFSYNDRQAHLQLFTSRLSVFSKHGVIGVVVTSTGTLCHACVLCSSTSVGQQSLQTPVQFTFCFFSEHWKHAVHCAILHYRSKNMCCHCHPALSHITLIHGHLVAIDFKLI